MFGKERKTKKNKGSDLTVETNLLTLNLSFVQWVANNSNKNVIRFTTLIPWTAHLKLEADECDLLGHGNEDVFEQLFELSEA